MRFGSLRHKILFAKPTGTVENSMRETVPSFSLYHPNLPEKAITFQDRHWYDESGALLDTSNCEYCLRAEVTPMTGREYEQAQKLRAEETYKVKTRFMPFIQNDMIIIYDDKTLQIQSILDVNSAHTQLDIICTVVYR